MEKVHIETALIRLSSFCRLLPCNDTLRSPDGQAESSGGYMDLIFDDVSNAIRGPSVVIVAVVVVAVAYPYRRGETLTLRHTDLSPERKPSAAVGAGVSTSDRDSATELELNSTLIKPIEG